MIIFYFLIFILFFLIIFLIIPFLFFGAPFLPSIKNREEIKGLIGFIDSLENGKKFIDLGSGDGRIVIEFAKRRYYCYGVEINPILFLISKIRVKLNKLKNVKIIYGNFWNLNLSHFDIIYFFHYKYANKFIEKKLKKEAKTGTIIISAYFPLEGQEFQLINKINGFYIYKKGSP